MSKKKKPAKQPPARKRPKKKPPSKIKTTNALAAFWEDAQHIVKLPAAVGGLILGSSGDQKSVAARLAEVTERVDAGELSMEVIDPILRSNPDIELHLGLLYEMMLCRFVDNFQTYITEILTEIYSNHPDLLVQSGIKLQLTTDNVFSSGSLKELRGRVIEQHVRGLIYENFAKLVKTLADPTQLKFKLFTSTTEIAFASSFFEVRNLLVHNRGVINHTFLDRVRIFRNIQLGQRPNVDPRYLHRVADFVFHNALEIDKRAVKQFKLETPVALEIKSPDDA